MVAVPPEKPVVTLAVGGSLDQLQSMPITAAQELGYVHEQGLEVLTPEYRNDGAALRQVESGAADFGTAYLDAVLRAEAAGRRLEVVCALGASPGLVLLASSAAPHIASVRDLAGKPVGVSDAASAPGDMVRRLAADAGLPPWAVRLVQVPEASMAALLASGRLAAAVATDPVAAYIERYGAGRELAETRGPAGTSRVFGGAWSGIVVFATQDFVSRHPVTTQALVRGLVQALRYIGSQPADRVMEIGIPGPLEGAGPPEVGWIQAQVARDRRMFTAAGLLDPAAAARVLDTVTRFDLAGRPVSFPLSRVFTNAFAAAGDTQILAQ